MLDVCCVLYAVVCVLCVVRCMADTKAQTGGPQGLDCLSAMFSLTFFHWILFMCAADTTIFSRARVSLCAVGLASAATKGTAGREIGDRPPLSGNQPPEPAPEPAPLSPPRSPCWSRSLPRSRQRSACPDGAHRPEGACSRG